MTRHTVLICRADPETLRRNISPRVYHRLRHRSLDPSAPPWDLGQLLFMVRGNSSLLGFFGCSWLEGDSCWLGLSVAGEPSPGKGGLVGVGAAWFVGHRLGVRRVCFNIAPDNTPAIRLALRLGARPRAGLPGSYVIDPLEALRAARAVVSRCRFETDTGDAAALSEGVQPCTRRT